MSFLSDRKRWLPIGGATAIALGAIVFSLCFHRSEPEAATLPPGVGVPDPQTITLADGIPQWRSVTIAPALVATTGWSAAIPARVTFDESHASKIGAPLGGRVTRVDVELGARVAAGDPLLRIASAEIAGLEAERDKTQVDLEAAKARLDRVSAMVDAKALPAKELEDARADWKSAQVAATSAQAKLDAIDARGADSKELTVFAPRAGVVVAKSVAAGQSVSSDAGDPLLVIADLSTVWVIADVFEADAETIHEGEPARIDVPSLPGAQWDATVDLVSAVVDPDRHSVPVRMHLANGDRRLKPNLYAEARFRTAAPGGSVTVAATAIVSDGADAYVYVEDPPGTFKRRKIEAGPTQDARVLVLGGLRPGERVVETGALLLDNQIALAQ